MKRVLIVARVSRDEGQDPHTQTVSLTAACDKQGWLVASVLERETSAWDEGESAVFRQEVMDAVIRVQPDIVAVWKTDRLCREGIEATLGLLRELEKHHGCDYYSQTEPFLSTATADPTIRPLLVAFMAWAAQQESQKRSERVKAKIASKKAHAAAGGGRAIWGRGRLPSDADKAEIVRLRGCGETIRSIAALVGLGKSTVADVLKSVRPDRAGRADTVEGTEPPKSGVVDGQRQV